MAQEGYTDTEIGLLSAITTLLEVLLALGVDPVSLSRPLEFQRDAHRAAGRPNAAAILDTLADYAKDHDVQKRREVQRLLLKAQTPGNA